MRAYAPRAVHVALRGRRLVGGAADSPGEVRGAVFVRDTRSGQFNVNAGARSTLALRARGRSRAGSGSSGS